MPFSATEILKRPTALSLIIVNTLPLFGVLLFGWSLFSVMFLYWFESAVVGFYSILKLAKVGKWLSLFLVPFFCVHFGGFMSVHLVFLVVLFSGKAGSEGFSHFMLIDSTFHEIMVPAVALFISHGHSYLSNFLARDEFSGSTVEKLMQAPYKRVIIMHLTILLGGFLILPFGQPIAGLVLLIVFKTISDLAGHVREREAFRKINY